MSDDLLKMLHEVFGGDPDVQVFAMDEDGVHPVNLETRTVTKVEVYHLVNAEGDTFGRGDTLLGPDDEYYVLKDADAPAHEGATGVLHCEDSKGQRIDFVPSVFDLFFKFDREVK